jgi:tRNA dimethylallyltransferase
LTDEELRDRLVNLGSGLHNTTDLLDRQRIIRALRIATSSGDIYTLPPMKITVFGMTHHLSDLQKRIALRLKQRLEEGMIDETKQLLERGLSHERLRYFGLEYKYISLYLNGELNFNDMRQKLESGIYEFARKQLKWYRKMEREGVKIRWVTEEQLIKNYELSSMNYEL